MNKLIKYSALVLALIIALPLLFGCGGSTQNDPVGGNDPANDGLVFETVPLPNYELYKNSGVNALIFTPESWMTTSTGEVTVFSAITDEGAFEAMSLSLICENTLPLDRDFHASLEGNGQEDLSHRRFETFKSYNGYDCIFYYEIDESSLLMTAYADIGDQNVLHFEFTEGPDMINACISVINSITLPPVGETEYSCEFSFICASSLIYENGEYKNVTIDPREFTLTLPSYCTVNPDGNLYRFEKMGDEYYVLYESIALPPRTVSVKLPASMSLESYLKEGKPLPFESKDATPTAPTVSPDELIFEADDEIGKEYAYSEPITLESGRQVRHIYVKTSDGYVIFLSTEVFTDVSRSNIKTVLDSLK